MSVEPTTTAAREGRYPLAHDADGNPLLVPESAVAWRIRRGGGRRGRPRHVFDAETGRQLEVPLGASIDDLIDGGCRGDRFLLYPVDAEGRVIPGIVAVTEVPELGEEAEDTATPDRIGDPATSLFVATIREQGVTIRHQAECLARALEATTQGYGRVRPVVEPPPVMMEPPAVFAPAEPAPSSIASFFSNLKPEQIGDMMSLAKLFTDMFRGMGGGGPAPSQPGVAP
jgi:hypothetical protein